MAELLVLAAGRRRYVVEALMRAKDPDDQLLVADQDAHTPGLSVPDAVAFVEPADPDEATAWLLETCRERGVSAVLSLHDYQALRIADLADDLRALGCRWIGPDPAWARTVLAKTQLAAYLAERDSALAIPTYTVSDFPGSAASMRWVVKEDRGSGSSGLRINLSTDEAQRALENDPQLVAQPCIDAEEWNLDFFVWPDGSVEGVSAKRKFRMRDGETDAAHVVPSDRVPFDHRRVTEAFSGRQHLGNVDVDVFVTGDSLQVIDVNPRFGGGYAFSMRAGYDAAAAVWDLAHRRDSPRAVEATREFVGAKSIEVVSL